MNLRSIAVLISVVVWMTRASAQQTPAIFPFEPAQLLTVLPIAPGEWKVIRSEADLTLGEWLETRATRVLQAPLPPPSVPTAVPEAPPGEIEITVVDTAGFAPALISFGNFTPSRNGNVEKKLIGGLPAIVIAGENGRQFIQVLASSRYLIELTLTHLPHQRAEDWLRAFHFESLPPSSGAPATRPREFRLTHIDELQPKNNRSYTVSTTNAKRVDAFLKTLPVAASEPAATEPTSSDSKER